MTEPNEDRDPMEVLAADFLARQRRGEHPSISEYVARHPELADQIQELLPAVALIEQLKAHRHETSGAGAVWGNLGLERLGDFRILGEIGRGGMGIVYEALQESLGRRVAVKVLPRQALLSPRQLERFQREAQTAARLHHTNIVPLFGVGEHEGFHYIVMQRILGVGLDAVLDQLRRWGGSQAALPDTLGPPPASAQAPTHDEATRLARGLIESDFWQFPYFGSVFRESCGEESDSPRLAPSSQAGRTGREHDSQAGSKTDAQGAAMPQTSTAVSAPSGSLRFGACYWRNVAAIGLQVAGALEYAHEHQTLHRDIKPANLLLDSQGIVWITDFGLAKALDEAPESQTGTIAGTLRYMAPEQLSGHLDCRSDVYSLGLTLYELLTLQAAFADTRRSNLIHKISREEPTRPRKLNPAIPRDLETIVLKAMAKDPADRYPTAGAMAHDLGCFLEDRPIAARRLHPLERLWRWSRRNRALAALAASTMTLLLLVAVVASWGFVTTRQANIEEARQRTRAEETSALALEALDNIFRQFAPDRAAPASSLLVVGDSGEEITVPVQPVLSKEAAALLEHMLGFYDRLAAQGDGDAGLRRKVAEASRRVGDIRQRLGQHDEAKDAYLRASERYAPLLDAAPWDTELRIEIARIQNELGNVYLAGRDRQKGREAYQSALKTLNQATPQASGSPGYRYELARTCYFLGRRPPEQSLPAPPPRDARFGPRPGPRGFSFDPRGPRPRGSDPHGRPLFPGPRPPDSPPTPRDPMAGPPPRDRHADRVDRPDGPHPPDPHEPDGGPRPPRPFESDDRREMLPKAIALLEKLVVEHPDVPDYAHLLACCYREIPPPRLEDAKDRSPEVAHRATEILEGLVQKYPAVADYRYDLSETYAMLDAQDPFGPDPPGRAERGQSRQILERALAISEELVAEHPNIPDYVASQVHIRMRLAALLWQSDPDAAEANLRKARDLEAALARRFPRNPSYQFWMAVIHESLARLLQQEGKLSEARSALEECIRLLTDATRRDPGERHIRWVLAHNHRNLADLLRRMGEDQAADEADRDADRWRGQ